MPRTGSFDAQTIHDYLGKDGKLFESDSVVYWLDPIDGHPPASHRTCPVGPNGAALCGKEVGRLLYMDVGRWGGSGTVGGDTDQHWRHQRDFGLVCGRVAALCSYLEPNTRRSHRIYASWRKSPKSQPLMTSRHWSRCWIDSHPRTDSVLSPSRTRLPVTFREFRRQHPTKSMSF